jgi:hypothetical protein
MLPWSGRVGSRFLLRFDTPKTMLDSQTCVVWGKGAKPPGCPDLGGFAECMVIPIDGGDLHGW